MGEGISQRICLLGHDGTCAIGRLDQRKSVVGVSCALMQLVIRFLQFPDGEAASS